MKKNFKNILPIFLICIVGLLVLAVVVFKIKMPSETNPNKVKLITEDIDHFWEAYDRAYPELEAEAFQKYYIDKGTSGLKGYVENRIRSAEYLLSVVQKHSNYYSSIRESSTKIDSLAGDIKRALIKLEEVYPEAIFPPVYFVIGAFNSAGTSTFNELVIGAEFYGLTSETPLEELNDWRKTNIKPLEEIPHIVTHELVHFQQNAKILNHLYSRNLLSASIKEGAADFLAELTSGKHINGHVHEFADSLEEELWLEFKSRMYNTDYSGWLYSQPQNRPSDLGYWMGYKIVEAYYQKAEDKEEAIYEIINVRNYTNFLEQSGYSEKFGN